MICLTKQMNTLASQSFREVLWNSFAEKCRSIFRKVLAVEPCSNKVTGFSQRNTKIRIVSFVLWLWNTKFLKLLRNDYILFADKLKNLKFYPNVYSFFWQRNTKFEVVLKQSFVSWLQTTKIELNYLFFQ